MITDSEMLYLYVETPLHVGNGGSVGVIDLPIQRDAHTDYPIIPGSALKGKLRAEIGAQLEKTYKAANEPNPKEKAEGFISIVFGAENNKGDYAGAIAPCDAKLLLFPVRSLNGVFAYTTSMHALAEYNRTLIAAGKTALPASSPSAQTAYITDGSAVYYAPSIVLEEYSFTRDTNTTIQPQIDTLAEALAATLPSGAEYDFFRAKVKDSLMILPNDDFRDFAKYSTEVVTRIRIDQTTKTVADGALWTEELVCPDTLFYAPLHATPPRTNVLPAGMAPTGEAVLEVITNSGLQRIQLGGDETVGRGMICLQFGANPIVTNQPGGEVNAAN